MKLQQLRYLCETAEHGMNLSRAAKNLHTSQPAISKQIQMLEDELGVDIFLRNGKRIVKITPPGQLIIKTATRMLRDADNLKKIAQEFTNEAGGTLTAFRYVLVKIDIIALRVKHFHNFMRC